MVRALVVTGFGINCEEEMAAAWRLAGAEADIVHLNQVFLGRVSLEDYQVLSLPGGFSFGDDLGSGVVLANKLRHKRLADGTRLMDAMDRFLADGGYILGVCNGFQALVKLGLLPDVGRVHDQEVTLTTNLSGRFEDRWVRCSVQGDSPWLTGLTALDLPVRHGEGRLVIRDEALKQAILDGRLNCMTYIDAQGAPTGEYPANPNGADLHCAGLVDPSGQILGMMPHPEAYLSAYNHPDWAGKKRRGELTSDLGHGLRFFSNLVGHLA